MLTRRGFFSTGALLAAGLVLDPERLLWRSGAKTIFLPSPPSLVTPVFLRRGDIFTIAGVHSVNPRTRVDTGWLQQFVVTDDVPSGRSVQNVIYPPLLSIGIYQNIASEPLPNAVISPIGVPR